MYMHMHMYMYAHAHAHVGLYIDLCVYVHITCCSGPMQRIIIHVCARAHLTRAIFRSTYRPVYIVDLNWKEFFSTGNSGLYVGGVAVAMDRLGSHCSVHV